MSVARRLASGTAANFLDKAAILAVQLAVIPVLNRHWGPGGYGSWLLLMTIPSYMALSDCGVGTASGVEATRRVAAGDGEGANGMLQTTLAFTGCIAGVAIAIAALYGWVFANAGLPILLACLYATAMVLMTLPATALQASGGYGLAQAITGLWVLVEGIALIGICSAGGTIAGTMLALLLTRCVGLVLMLVAARVWAPWFHFGCKRAARAELAALLRPSLAALALTASGALLLQGMVLTLGWTSGAAAVAVFGAARLLTRIPLQFTGLLARASQPELTRAHAARDYAVMQRLSRLNIGAGLLVGPIAVVVLSLAGPHVLVLMSGGVLHASWRLFLLLGLSASLNAVWTAAATSLLAVNRQERFAYWALLLSALAVVIPLLGWPEPALAAGLAMVLADTAMLGIVWSKIAPLGASPAVAHG